MAASAIAVFCAFPAAGQGDRVLVHDGEGGIHAMGLTSDGRLNVQTSLGYNIVVVENGTAFIEDADCPNLDCTRQRAISKPGQQLVCLPHKLWVEIVPAGHTGGSMDVEAVVPEDGSDGSAELDTIAR